MYRFRVVTNLARDLDNIRRKSPDMYKGIVKDASRALRKSAKQRSPKDSGELKESIRARVQQTTSGFTGVVYARAIRHTGKDAPYDYARAQEFGFTPHAVPPADWNPKSKALIPSTGLIWVKRFKPFMKPALDQYLDSGFEAAINKHLTQVGLVK